MWKTKCIETELSEKRLLERLKTLCTEKTLFDRGYIDKDVFVVKRNKNKFWICKHVARVWNHDGYINVCIYCKYSVNENGKIEIEYRFGKLLSLIFPFIACFIMGISIWLALVYEAIACANVQWGGLCITAIFWILGLFEMLYYPRKEMVALEKHLLRICNTES